MRYLDAVEVLSFTTKKNYIGVEALVEETLGYYQAQVVKTQYSYVQGELGKTQVIRHVIYIPKPQYQLDVEGEYVLIVKNKRVRVLSITETNRDYILDCEVIA